MLKPVASLCGAFILSVVGSGCVSLAEHEDLKARYSAQSEKFQRVSEDMGRRNATLELEIEKRDANLAMRDVMIDSKDKELTAAKAIREEILAKFGSLVPPAGSEGSGDIEFGRDYIRFSGEVLFDSGKTDIKAQ